MEKMRICIISREYPPLSHTGGIGTYSHVAASGLAQAGHHVHVITVADEREEVLNDNGANVHRILIHPFLLPKSRLFYPYRVVARKLLFQFLESQAWSYSAAIKLKTLIEKEKIQVVEFAETSAEGYDASFVDNVKRVCRLHIGSATESSSNLRGNVLSRKKLHRREKRSILDAHYITCPSKALAEYTAKDMGIHEDRIGVFPNPLDSLFVDSDAAPKQGFDHHLLFVGRVERRKGIDILLGAFVNLLSRFPQSKLKIIGQDYGYYYDPVRKSDRLKEIIQTYGIAKSVEFIPRIKREELLRHFAWADAVVVPSINENLPYTVLEGMSQARTVVASDCGGIPEMISQGETGIIFPTGDINELTRSLTTLWENPQRAQLIGARAKAKVRETYSAKAIVPRIEEIYRKVLQ